jgi:hypothetical protein
MPRRQTMRSLQRSGHDHPDVRFQMHQWVGQPGAQDGEFLVIGVPRIALRQMDLGQLRPAGFPQTIGRQQLDRAVVEPHRPERRPRAVAEPSPTGLASRNALGQRFPDDSLHEPLEHMDRVPFVLVRGIQIHQRLDHQRRRGGRHGEGIRGSCPHDAARQAVTADELDAGLRFFRPLAPSVPLP